MPDPEDAPWCINEGEGNCRGNVEWRMPLARSTASFPRCDFHWDQRLEREEEINTRYPDTPTPPADFDPSYAGETWDEE